MALPVPARPIIRSSMPLQSLRIRSFQQSKKRTTRKFWNGTMNIKLKAVSSSRLSINPTAMRNSLREFDQRLLPMMQTANPVISSTAYSPAYSSASVREPSVLSLLQMQTTESVTVQTSGRFLWKVRATILPERNV